MKAILRKWMVLLVALICSTSMLVGQIDVEVTITGGTATSTCTNEPFLSPNIEPLWRVDVENEGYVLYTDGAGCFTDLPNVQYSTTYSCAVDIPATLQVCFEAFENDNALYEINLGCGITENCVETICQDFTIPAPGTSANETLSIDPSMSSSGSVDFTITTGADPTNDLICSAIDLGIINSGDQIGDVNAGVYDNLCGTDINDLNPSDFANSWENDRGVWFTFMTSATVGPELIITLLNDPEMVGDSIDLQIALFTSDDNTCNGNISFVRQAVDINSFDIQLNFNCPMPDTRYFLLVDGGYDDFPHSLQGFFSLQILDVGIMEAGDTPCQAENLGVIPANGSVSTDGMRSNFCATGSGDPFNPSFVTQTSVWFQFTPPPSGHVLIEAFSDTEVDSIGLQLAIYRAFGNNCSGIFIHTQSIYTFEDLDESMEVSCLYDDRPYWIMIDGDGGNGRGIFSLTVSDAGDITPVEMLVDTICAGQSFSVGPSSYSATGMYSDTIQVFAGCDSIVNTNLTVLPAIEVTINQTQPAVLQGGANGIAEVSATGGTGIFSYAWCSGETSATANALVGGDFCCVTVTDDFGCEAVECFVVEFVTPIIPTFENDTLLCNGDMNGTLSFSAADGYPPYNYVWQNMANTINGSGVINAENEMVTLPNLPAGNYAIQIVDAFFDTTFTAVVAQPEQVELMLLGQTDASCFAYCDGVAELEGTGGVGNFSYQWPGGLAFDSLQTTLCAGTYEVTVVDGNSCEATLEITVDEPEEFIATATETNPVSCFEGSDGAAQVSTNGTPVAYSWDNMTNMATINGLEAGTYFVTVTNSDGCLDTTFVEITQPDQPVGVQISLSEDISCYEASDGALLATVSGPGSTFSYNWSNGDLQALATGLGAGTYDVEVSNELGCIASASFDLQQPDEIQAAIQSNDITCLDPINGGNILIDTVFGGRPNYSFSLDGEFYTSNPGFGSLMGGNYTVFVKDASECVVQYAINILPPPDITVTLGDDFSVQLGEEVVLEAETNSTTPIFKWSALNIDTFNTNPASITVFPFESTGYTVTVTDTASFCMATASVFVSVVKDRKIFIPNAFSPNDDGANDIFYIFAGPGLRQIKNFRIFTRTGNMIFETENVLPNDPSFGWDGSFKNQDLNAGVYVYMAEIEFLDGITEVFKGSVVLMR